MFLKKTKKQLIYNLYNSILTNLKKLKNKYFKYLILSFTLFNYKKHLNLISPLNIFLLQLTQNTTLQKLINKTNIIFNFNINPFHNINNKIKYLKYLFFNFFKSTNTKLYKL